MFSFTLIWFAEKFNLINAIVTKYAPSDSQKATYSVLLTIACIVVGYLIGSVNFGVLLQKKAGSDGENVPDTTPSEKSSTKTAVLSFLFDSLKGAVAVIIGGLLLGTNHAAIDGAAIAGLFCVIGHIFPVFFKFKGGKGVATASMVILVTRPWIFLILFAAFLVIVIGTKYVSLASTIPALLYPVILFRLDTLRGVPGGNGWNVLCSVLIALLILFSHRHNLKRLQQGKEPKLSASSSGKENKSK